ncbi:hypothetical protein R1sor_009136 [Riccia sorocarpa]|uniref:Trimethylguanosine synthase n=1 Tax=Riccia sorocarpa TaxID=122646 RepID=A0ABD3H7R2_9MARC
MKNPRSEDVEDADGQTPKEKSKPAKNLGSGRSSKAKKGKEKEKEMPKETTKEVTKEKGRMKKDQSDDEAGVDQYVDIPNQFAVLKSSLKSTFETIQANKNRAKILPVPIIDELKKTCIAMGPMRMSGFLLNGKQSSFAADCLYLDLPSGLNLEAEVFCKWGADFQIPKTAGPPFDVENLGRESAVIYNYNTIAPKKLDDLGRRKCTGFVQTLLENFTKHGDIVIDFAGGWGASLQAAFNCSRCCIVAEERQEAYDNLHLTVATIAKAKDNLTPESSSQPVSQTAVGSLRGKKPLGEDDDLGDDIF